MLIVDSHIETNNRLKEMVSENTNCRTIYTATSFIEARSILSNIKPEILILDLNLPQNQSVVLLREIRKTHPDILIIILSIHIDANIKTLCMELGADHFFDKYNEFDKIVDMIVLKKAF